VTGRALVDVNNEDVNGVIVNLAPSVEVSGRVVIERQTAAPGPDPALSVLNVVLRTDPILPESRRALPLRQPMGRSNIPPDPMPRRCKREITECS